MTITIDGYAGTGKSTAARLLAEAIGYELLNTGAMYRAIGEILDREGIDLELVPRAVTTIRSIVGKCHFELRNNIVFINGEDRNVHLRTERMNALASKVGTFREVREHLKAEQIRIATGKKIICEGRDQGTVVFPKAILKFFFIANVEVRALRRMLDLEKINSPASYHEVYDQIIARDHQDETRELDPLKEPLNAVRIDTSAIKIDGVLTKMFTACEAVNIHKI